MKNRTTNDLHTNDPTFKLQVELDKKVYFICSDDAIENPQWLSVKQFLSRIEKNTKFVKSSLKLLHKDGYTVEYANSLDAYNNPFPCEQKDSELLLKLINLIKINNLDNRIANFTLRNSFLKLSERLNYIALYDPGFGNSHTLLNFLPNTLPTTYEPSVCEPTNETSMFHLAIQAGSVLMAKKLFNICNTNKEWLTNEITQGLSRKASHIVSALTTNSTDMITFIFSILPVSKNELSSIEASFCKLPTHKQSIAGAGLKILIKLIADKRKSDLQKAIKNNELEGINLFYDEVNDDINELIKFALNEASNPTTLANLTQKALKTLKQDINQSDSLLVLASNKLIDNDEINGLISNSQISGDTLASVLANLHLPDNDKIIEQNFDKFSIQTIKKLTVNGKISAENSKLIFNLPIDKICQEDLLAHLWKSYPNNETLVRIISQLELNHVNFVNHKTLLPLMLAYHENTDKIAHFIRENKYNLTALLLDSLFYKKDRNNKQMLLNQLDSPSNKFDLLLAKKLGDDEIFNKIASMNGNEILTIDVLDGIRIHSYISLTPEIKDSIFKIQAICNSRFDDQAFYGNDALNRKMLLDAEIADLLTPEVIAYLFTNPPIPETKIKRNSTGVINLRDAIYFGFKEGLEILHKLPNNESSFGLKGYQKQDADFRYNTMKIVKNISLAAGVSHIEIEKESDVTFLIKQFQHLAETVNLLKKADKTDFLLFVPGYSVEEIRKQTENGFKKLISYIDDLKKETLEGFCDKVLNNSEAMLDGTVIHLFYDRVHLEAALEQETLFCIGGKDYLMQEILYNLILAIVNNPNHYFYAQEQFCLRLALVEKHLKGKFKAEYEQAAFNLGHMSKRESDPSDFNMVYEGPQNKTMATFELEQLVQWLLLASKENKPLTVTFNEQDEMILSVYPERYNLTSILKGEPNWEHLNFGPTEIADYELFLKNVINPPVYSHIERDVLPAAIAKIKIEFPQLSLAECSAIRHYSSNLYTVINNLIRFNGQSGFIDSAPSSDEYSRALYQFNNMIYVEPGKYPSNLNKMITETLLASAFVSHALTKTFCYDRMMVASSLQELQTQLTQLSGFLIAVIGEGDKKQIAVVQHGEIINFDKANNLPTLNFETFYTQIKARERSILSFTEEEISTIRQALNTPESCKLISFGSISLDNRFLGCLIQELGDENVYPLKEIYRADRISPIMDSLAHSIVDAVSKEGQAYIVSQGFYSASEELQSDLFHYKSGIATTLVFPRGTAFRATNLSTEPAEKEFLFPPGQQLLYMDTRKKGKHREFSAKPVRGILYKEQSSTPGVAKALNTFGLLNQGQLPDEIKNKDKHLILK